MSLFNPPLTSRNPAAPAAWPGARPGLPRAEAHTYGSCPNDVDFVALQVCLRPSGGLARGDDLALCLGRLDQGQDHSSGHARLARLMVSGQVFSFAWLDTYWLPMFQFDPVSLGLCAQAREVLRELVEVLDGWSLAVWFVQPCSCLGSRSPLTLLRSDPPAVLHAARLQCYVVKA